VGPSAVAAAARVRMEARKGRMRVSGRIFVFCGRFWTGGIRFL